MPHSLTQLDSARLSSTQLDLAWLSLTQLYSAQLSSTQLNSAWLNSTQLFSDQTVCVWCRQMSSNCPFFSFLARPHSRWGVIIKVLRTQRDIVTYHIDKMAALQCNTDQRCCLKGSIQWDAFLLNGGGDQMALFPPLTNPNPRITIYQMCLSRY